MCLREKDPEPDDSVSTPLTRGDLREAATASIAQREREYLERMMRFSAVTHK